MKPQQIKEATSLSTRRKKGSIPPSAPAERCCERLQQDGWTRWTVGQQLYLEAWNNEEVESMLLGMELFLLVRHTHLLLEQTWTRRCSHKHTPTAGELMEG